MKTQILTFPVLLTVAAHGAPALTIYNGDLAVVRETVPLDLKAGENAVVFDHATAQVQADSVVLRDPAGKGAFSILEQGYRNDPVSEGLLLNYFEGKSIEFRIDYPDGKSELKQGKIVRSGYLPGGDSQDPIIEMDGKLRFELPGKPLFPELGNDSILRPALSWTLQSAAVQKFDAQLSYLSQGFSWKATYNVVAPEDSDTVSLTGWVTVSNESGTAFKDADVKLVAGDVNVVKAQESEEDGVDYFSPPPKPTQPQVTEKSFDDFHLYTIGRPLTLRDQETKQVEFQRAPKVKAVKKYIYDPTADRSFGDEPESDPEAAGEEASKKISIYWEFRNDESNGLGVPLPAGKIRFYRADSSDSSLQFVGEDTIEHTPKNEVLRLNTGNAFDLTGERKVMNFTRSERQKTMDEMVKVTVKNHSKTAKEITVREHPWRWGNWQILNNSDPFNKIDAGQIEFTVKLAPEESKEITYTAHYAW